MSNVQNPIVHGQVVQGQVVQDQNVKSEPVYADGSTAAGTRQKQNVTTLWIGICCCICCAISILIITLVCVYWPYPPGVTYQVRCIIIVIF